MGTLTQTPTTTRRSPAPALLAPADAWIPQEVRCPRCQAIASEDDREQLAPDEVAVRYGCYACRWQQTRYYHAHEIESDAL